MKIDKKYIENEVKNLDKNLLQTDEAFRVACILLTSTQVGTDTKKIAEFLHYDESIVKKYEKNLRQNKVWVKDQVAGSEWFEKPSGSIAFWLDVSVAIGYIKKVDVKKKK